MVWKGRGQLESQHPERRYKDGVILPLAPTAAKETCWLRKPVAHPVIVSGDMTFVSPRGSLRVSTPFIYPRLFPTVAHVPWSSLFDLFEDCQLIAWLHGNWILYLFTRRVNSIDAEVIWKSNNHTCHSFFLWGGGFLLKQILCFVPCA